MRIAVTGSTSGIGKSLVGLLEMRHKIVYISRDIINLGNEDCAVGWLTN